MINSKTFCEVVDELNDLLSEEALDEGLSFCYVYAACEDYIFFGTDHRIYPADFSNDYIETKEDLFNCCLSEFKKLQKLMTLKKIN